MSGVLWFVVGCADTTNEVGVSTSPAKTETPLAVLANEPNAPDFSSTSGDHGYFGSEACSSCHLKDYET